MSLIAGIAEIKTGNKNWSKELNSKPAAKRKVPDFDPAMAPL